MYTADIAESIFHVGLDFIFWGVLPDFLNLDRGHLPYYPTFNNIVIYLLTLNLIIYLINFKFFKGKGSVFSYFTIKFPDFIKFCFYPMSPPPISLILSLLLKTTSFILLSLLYQHQAGLSYILTLLHFTICPVK